MNPIFSRRYRAGNNSSASQPASQSKSASVSPSKQLPDNDFVVKPLLKSTKKPSQEKTKSKTRSFSPESYEKYNHHRKSEASSGRRLSASKSLTFNSSLRTSPSPSGESSKSFAQILLESKQNMLAGISLTPKENRQRRSVNDSAKCPPSTEIVKTIPDSTMTLCDIEDEDFFGLDEVKPCDRGSYSKPDHCSHSRNLGTKKSLDLKTWRELKNIVIGPGGSLQGGWIGQGFSFDTNIPFGIVQKKGGPCGVLAVVQALTLRNLIFGSEFCEEGLDDGFHDECSSIGASRTSTDFLFAQPISSNRTIALCGALVEILWRCAHWSDSTDKDKSVSARSTHNSPGGCIVCFSGTSVGDDMKVFDDQNELKYYIRENLYRMDCVGLVYSALLTRGLEAVQDDMDFPESPLLGQHGYCSQELVNLLLIGKAISNSFDDQILLGDKVLKGIESQSDVGLLSLFEHYDSCQVGSYLKNPKFPFWIICSESHFSVLFSLDLMLATDTDVKNFDLYYYDGLARQQSILKLTIGFKKDDGHNNSSLNRSYGLSGIQLNNNYDYQDEDLVPPLEKCIRTKWKGAIVNWNGSEPIL